MKRINGVRRAQGALANHLACDHVVPRNCVAEALIRDEWIDLGGADACQELIPTHAEVAILVGIAPSRWEPGGGRVA